MSRQPVRHVEQRFRDMVPLIDRPLESVCIGLGHRFNCIQAFFCGVAPLPRAEFLIQAAEFECGEVEECREESLHGISPGLEEFSFPFRIDFPLTDCERYIFLPEWKVRIEIRDRLALRTTP